MNNTSTIRENFAHIIDRIEVFADVVLMAVGLMFFGIWFTMNMNNYLGKIGTLNGENATSHVVAVEFAEVIPAAIPGE